MRFGPCGRVRKRPHRKARVRGPKRANTMVGNNEPTAGGPPGAYCDEDLSGRSDPVATSTIVGVANMEEERDYPWFNLADYEPRRQFDFRDWAIMLYLRDRTADDIDRNLQTEGCTFEETSDEHWLLYLGEALPLKNSTPKPTNGSLKNGPERPETRPRRPSAAFTH